MYVIKVKDKDLFGAPGHGMLTDLKFAKTYDTKRSASGVIVQHFKKYKGVFQYSPNPMVYTENPKDKEYKFKKEQLEIREVELKLK